VLTKFRNVYEKMHSALDGMPYDELGISDEVKEQVRDRPEHACSLRMPDRAHMDTI
jgi:hypothetical protein